MPGLARHASSNWPLRLPFRAVVSGRLAAVCSRALETRLPLLPINEPIKPREAGGRRLRRIVFAADVAVVLQILEEAEEERIVDLADLRLVTAGDAGNLEMADVRQPAADLLRKIALDDLRVVEVHLHLEIRRRDVLADRMRLGLRREQIVRHVARVERLDQDRHALLRGLRAGELEIARIRTD